VHTTELDWPDQARTDGWSVAQGQWQHEDRAESDDDGEWVYLGDGVWEVAQVASLPVDGRRQLLEQYGDALMATAVAIQREQARERRREQ
jgi:hypothetical protein